MHGLADYRLMSYETNIIHYTALGHLFAFYNDKFDVYCTVYTIQSIPKVSSQCHIFTIQFN